MKPKSLLSAIITVIIFAFVIYNNIPRYHEFINETGAIGSEEYNYVEITSEEPSPIAVKITTEGNQPFDAFLMSEGAMDQLTAWMQTDDLEQPEIQCMAKWENVTSVDAVDISMGVGTYFLVIDNTILGTPASETPVTFAYSISEKY